LSIVILAGTLWVRSLGSVGRSTPRLGCGLPKADHNKSSPS
jgi:hypothetical protein